MKSDTIAEYQRLVKDENMVLTHKNCPMSAAMKVLSGKWKFILINTIRLDSPARYGKLKRKISGITPNMLALQLRELERDGIIHRKVYPEVPPKVEYTITDFGKTLLPIMESLCGWGIKYFLAKNSTKTR
jgi:DNA-binding HxlR family transcriptional regulator